MGSAENVKPVCEHCGGNGEFYVTKESELHIVECKYCRGGIIDFNISVYDSFQNLLSLLKEMDLCYPDSFFKADVFEINTKYWDNKILIIKGRPVVPTVKKVISEIDIE